MHHLNDLEELFHHFFHWNRARIRCIVPLILAFVHFFEPFWIFSGCHGKGDIAFRLRMIVVPPSCDKRQIINLFRDL